MAWIVFLDEAGFLMAPLLRRSWAPRGHTPQLYHRTRHHRKVSAIAALCVSPSRNHLRCLFRLFPDQSIDAPRLIGEMANFAPLDLDALTHKTRRTLRSIQRQSQRLRSLLAHSPLSLRLK